MASQIKVNEIIKQSGSSISIGESGDTINITGNTAITGTLSSTGTSFGGLEVADQFRVNATFTGDADPITSNWERIDTAGQGTITSSQMSESSGIFTFPSTGIYLVRFIGGARAYSGNTETQYELLINVTTNNSSYACIAESHQAGSGSNSDLNLVVESLIDVTDVANVKVSVGVDAVQSNSMFLAGSAKNDNSLTCEKLGAT